MKNWLQRIVSIQNTNMSCMMHVSQINTLFYLQLHYSGILGVKGRCWSRTKSGFLSSTFSRGQQGSSWWQSLLPYTFSSTFSTARLKTTKFRSTGCKWESKTASSLTLPTICTSKWMSLNLSKCDTQPFFVWIWLDKKCVRKKDCQSNLGNSLPQIHLPKAINLGRDNRPVKIWIKYLLIW